MLREPTDLPCSYGFELDFVDNFFDEDKAYPACFFVFDDVVERRLGVFGNIEHLTSVGNLKNNLLPLPANKNLDAFRCIAAHCMNDAIGTDLIYRNNKQMPVGIGYL